MSAARAAALRWTGYVALAIVFAIACVYLSQWQFARNEERGAQLALVAQNYDEEPVPITELLDDDGAMAPGDEWRPVVMTGRYLQDEQVLARNRPRGGTSAFEVLTPLQLDDGSIVIVNRGWVPPGEGTVPDEIPEAPSGDVTVTARLRPGEQLPASGRTAPEGQVPTIHLPTIAEATGPSTVTGAYALMVSEQPAPATAPRPIDRPTDDPGPHLSYAIQWILFAIMGFIFIGYIIRTEIKHHREDREDDGNGVATRPRTPVRKKDRDMSDEDAILDAAGR